MNNERARSETTGRTADPLDDLTEKLDALIRSAKENTEQMVELRLAAEKWKQEWLQYQKRRRSVIICGSTG